VVRRSLQPARLYTSRKHSFGEGKSRPRYGLIATAKKTQSLAPPNGGSRIINTNISHVYVASIIGLASGGYTGWQTYGLNSAKKPTDECEMFLS
jgi:hypothetical protein